MFGLINETTNFVNLEKKQFREPRFAVKNNHPRQSQLSIPIFENTLLLHSNIHDWQVTNHDASTTLSFSIKLLIMSHFDTLKNRIKVFLYTCRPIANEMTFFKASSVMVMVVVAIFKIQAGHYFHLFKSSCVEIRNKIMFVDSNSNSFLFLLILKCDSSSKMTSWFWNI